MASGFRLAQVPSLQQLLEEFTFCFPVIDPSRPHSESNRLKGPLGVFSLISYLIAEALQKMAFNFNVTQHLPPQRQPIPFWSFSINRMFRLIELKSP